MHFVRFAKFITALFALTAGFAAPSHAQNNKPIVSGTFYEDRASATVSNTTLVLKFAQSPTDKFLNITNIACNIALSSGQALAQVNFYVGTASGADDLGRDYAIRGNATPENLSTTKYYSIVTNQIYYKMGLGRYPSVAIVAPLPPGGGIANITSDCVVVGNLTDS